MKSTVPWSISSSSALPVDQRIAQREILREAHERVVRRLVAVRVVFTEHVAHHARRLHRLRVGTETHFVHREQDAALHRLLAVADVRQRAALHDADRVAEVRLLGVVAERQRIGVRCVGAGKEIGSVVVHLNSVFLTDMRRAGRAARPCGCPA